MFGFGIKRPSQSGPNGIDLKVAFDVRNISSARLKRECVRLLRDAREVEDYMTAQAAIDTLVYRITGNVGYLTRPTGPRQEKQHNGGNQQQNQGQSGGQPHVNGQQQHNQQKTR
jgi:hypothetical protein